MESKSVAWLTSFLTIMGVSISNLVLFWGSASFWIKLVFIAALVAAVVLAVIDIQTWLSDKAKHHKNERSVNKYMLDLLKRGGSASIFANNLSWIRKAPEVRELLKSQARHGSNVRIFVPRHNDLTRSLATDGVEVKTYSSLNYEPSARFTLLNPDEPGSSLLAIGKGAFPEFYTEEFTDKTHSRVLAVARDLLNILDRVSDRDDA